MERFPDPPRPIDPSTPPRRGGAFVRELLGTLVPAIVIALLINLYLAQSTLVLGQSMEPSLHQDQRLIMEKVAYHLHAPRRGDIVILRDPTGGTIPLIKRVVGLPGEQVTVTARSLWGGDPMVVRVGQSTFALRRAEAACVRVESM